MLSVASDTAPCTNSKQHPALIPTHLRAVACCHTHVATSCRNTRTHPGHPTSCHHLHRHQHPRCASGAACGAQVQARAQELVPVLVRAIVLHQHRDVHWCATPGVWRAYYQDGCWACHQDDCLVDWVRSGWMVDGAKCRWVVVTPIPCALEQKAPALGAWEPLE